MEASAADLANLKVCSIAELEALFASERPLEVPRGRFRGTYLRPLENEGSRRPLNRLMQYAGFKLTPFGVDFTARTWFFFGPRLRVGRFEPRIEPSRWRSTGVVALHYDRSRIPAPIRRVLYDEVKPLGDDLCLGIGGLNDRPGRGDLFFFALSR